MRFEMIKALMVAALLAAPVLSGCERGPAGAPPAPPPPEVGVITVSPEPVVLTTELPGRATSYRMSEIRPQVSGLIQKRLFEEGSEVKAGDVLYEIDPAPYQAAYESARASVEAAAKAAERARAAVNASVANVTRQQAMLKLAKTNLGRFDELVKERAVSASQRDQAATDVDVAQASLLAAEAQVESERAAIAAAEAAIKQAEAAMRSAEISLGYTKITAPISGRIGRSNVTEGAAVTAFQPLALATIQQLDPIYVDVPQSTSELNRLRRSVAGGTTTDAQAELNSVRLVLQDGTELEEKGTLKFRDVTVDPSTGSVTLRVEVPNPQGMLLPGMFVRAVIEQARMEAALLIPQQAVTRDPRGAPMTLVVDAEDKVQQRMLTADRAVGNRWLVTSGLEAGDRVVVEGIQRARPGAAVRVTPMGPAPAGSPSQPEGAGAGATDAPAAQATTKSN